MASSFADLAESCEGAVAKLGAVAKKIAAAESADALRSLNTEAARYQRDADSSMRKMEAEAKAAAPSQRRVLLEQISTVKASLQKARTAVQQANDAQSRASLMKPTDKAKAQEAEAHDKLEAAASKSSLGTQRLQQASQVINETQDIGINIIDTMQQQRESLLRSTSKATEVNTLTDRARGIMRLMQARAVTNKALLVFAVIMLLAAVGCVVYFGYVANPKK